MRTQIFSAFMALLLAGLSTYAEEPLREAIDRFIEVGQAGKIAPPATDGEFLRRVYLDLTGIIPTSSDAKGFLDDPSPYKRERLVDRLLDSPEFARRMQVVFDVMWLERRPNSQVPAAAWRDYLRSSIAANKPLDQLVREILSADGSDPNTRPSAAFALERGGDPHVLTRDTARIFLGRDITCSQCHDHVLYDDYKQAHYYGLYAFFSRTYLAEGTGPEGKGALGEKGEGDVEYKSVFKRKVSHTTGPKLIDVAPAAEPNLPKGEEYWAFPVNKSRAVPKHSRRAMLPGLLTSEQTPEFRRNLANRLWAMMMGRGLVHPVDLNHGENPASHPELVVLLGDSLAKSGYDLKVFLREIAGTRTYARSSEPPPNLSPGELGPEKFTVAGMKPLTPEQMGWSVMQACGIVGQYKSNIEREMFEVDPKLRDLLTVDAKRERMRIEMAEAELYRRLEPSLSGFLQHFARPPGQAQDTQSSTVNQALFLTNGEPLQGWVSAGGTRLNGRLVALTDNAAAAEELYLSVLTRRPTAEEQGDVLRYLTERGKDRSRAMRELAWALITSTEFRFNH